ncbi:MAG: response regulator [Candidatus Kaiserbacteria bacterium]|nr:response regulator [Candidatus Kaiserbacteria bacterium]
MRILVIDNDISIREGMQLRFGFLGYHATFAANGPEGLAMLPEVEPQLAIVDYRMAPMDGLEVAHRIRAMPEFADLPVIMYSSGLPDHHLARLPGLKVDLVLKPSTMPLFDKVEAIAASLAV